MAGWAYGVTTCAERLKTLLPRTLVSLRNAGFTDPLVFADGVEQLTLPNYTVVCRGKSLKTVGNFALGLWELLVRNPTASKFAMFQDDLIACSDLMRYLDTVRWPAKGYLNLYTFPQNQAVAPSAAPGNAGTCSGWFESKECNNGPLYHGKRVQKGLGALALCFTREAVVDLLSSRHLVERPIDACFPTSKLDGCIVTALAKEGWREYCHDPSLVQHIGVQSSMGNNRHPDAPSFKGEHWSPIKG